MDGSKHKQVQVMILICLFLFLRFTPAKDIHPFHIAGYAQGTTYHITYFANDSVVSKKVVDSVFAQMDASLSIYKPQSLINQFNQSKEGIPVDAHFLNVVRKGLQVHKKTRGAFDMTVLPLTEAWGFGAAKSQRIPDSATIRSLLPCVGSDKLQLRKKVLIKHNPCVRVDVNGIAQGYTVYVLAALLEKKGIRNYLVEVGGEIRVKGRKQPGGEPFSIGIEAPSINELDAAPMQRVIHLERGGLTTSGNYRNYYLSGNKRITHLFDPKTGFPVQNELISVTVWAQDAITADAYDNALMVLGLEKSFRLLTNTKNLEAYFIYQKKDGTISDTATTGFYKLINNLSEKRER
ncbi:MAG: FAD:protein FMN transferase [Flavisolibacter sp.]|nr:FAD:protein FMN transferase [Flavisolibacter sp.]